MQAIQTNDLVFTNKHQSRLHKCTAGNVDISMAEVLCFYKSNFAEENQAQISRTPLLVLAQNMTDDELNAALFTKEEWAVYKSDNGGVEAIAALRTNK